MLKVIWQSQTGKYDLHFIASHKICCPYWETADKLTWLYIYAFFLWPHSGWHVSLTSLFVQHSSGMWSLHW